MEYDYNAHPNINGGEIVKLRLKNKVKEETKDIGLKCEWCKFKITNFPYYVCIFHNHVYCCYCMNKKGDLRNDFVKCPEQKKDLKDCIFKAVWKT